MTTSIVITSIFPPTESVVWYSKMTDYEVIVIGDNKTPKGWSCANVKYYSVDQSDSLGFELAKKLPYNHYCRKMIGYLVAIQNDSDFIIDTDDDNAPNIRYGFPAFDSKYHCISVDKGFINIYELYTEKKIWPRGLPLDLIGKEFKLENELSLIDCKVGIWQGLADGDPDVDAIYRLVNNDTCYFNQREPVVLGKGTISPFNTQNTIIRKDLYPLMYLPAFVTFRFTDILRSLIAQPIMWIYNYQLGFISPTVVQERNPHDYMADFISEIPMYLHTRRVIELVSNSISKSTTIECNLYNAYNCLLKDNIVCDKEMILLELWLKDIANLS